MWKIQIKEYIENCYRVLHIHVLYFLFTLLIGMALFTVSAESSSPSGHLVVINGVHLIPRNPRVGEIVVATFRLRNETNTTVTIRRLVAGTRGPNACGRGWNASHADFPVVENITLKPYQEYFYSQPRMFDTAGDYFVEPVMQDLQGRWGGIRPFPRVWFNVQDASGYISPPECLIVEGDIHLSKDVARKGEEVEVEFYLRNNGRNPIFIKRLVAAVRGPNGPTLGWSAPHADFPAVTDITLMPGETYAYRQRRSFNVPGEYFVEPAFMDERGKWGGIWPWPRREFSIVPDLLCAKRVSIVRPAGPLFGYLDFIGGLHPCGQRAPVFVRPDEDSPKLPQSRFVRIHDPQIERVEPQEVEGFPEPGTLQLVAWSKAEAISSCKACNLDPPIHVSGCVLARCTPHMVLFSHNVLSSNATIEVEGCIAYVDIGTVEPQGMGKGNVVSVSFLAPLRSIPFVGEMMDAVPLFLADKWASEIVKVVEGKQSYADAAWIIFVDLAKEAGAEYISGKLEGEILGVQVNLTKKEAFKDLVIGPILSEMVDALEENAPEWVVWYTMNHKWPYADLPHCTAPSKCYLNYHDFLEEFPLAYQYIHNYKIIYCSTGSDISTEKTPEPQKTTESSPVIQPLYKIWEWLRRILGR